MPDLPFRPQHEADVAYGISTVLSRQSQRLRTYGVDRLDERPAADWRNDEDEIAAAIIILLMRPWEQAQSGLAGRWGLIRRPDEAALDYRKWVREYAKKTAGEIEATTRKRAIEAAKTVRDSLAKRLQPGSDGATLYLPGSPEFEREQSALRLAGVADVNRIVNIAATTVTDATSAGEIAASNAIYKQLGLKLAPFWVTERDGRVCPICRAKHGKQIHGMFAGGEFPSAHPGCRCWVEWRLVNER